MYHFLPNIRSLRCPLKLFSVFLLALNVYTINAQTASDSIFEKSINLNVLNTLKSYSSIDSTFSKFKNDSLKMKTLIEKTKQSKALEVESYALNALGAIYRNLSYYDKALKELDMWIKLNPSNQRMINKRQKVLSNSSLQ